MEDLYVWNNGNYCTATDMNEDVAIEFGFKYQVLTADTTFRETLQMDDGIIAAINDYFKSR